MIDYYKILEIDKNASQEEIKAAYRKLAAKHHPDRGGDTSKFQEIQQAYSVLSNPVEKQRYDNPRPEFSFNFGGGGSPFDDFFSAFTKRVFSVVVNITLEQVANGGQETIRLATPSGEKIFNIDIPKGVDEGQAIKYNNVVDDAILQIVFRIVPHPIYARSGLNLKITKKINIFELIIGTKIDVNTIYNKTMSLTIPPKTTPGTVLRMPQCGLESNSSKGDLYVLIEAEIPSKISNNLINEIKKEIGV